jgi:hypothetical protein
MKWSTIAKSLKNTDLRYILSAVGTSSCMLVNVHILLFFEVTD